jgi:hypothetical protein
MPHALISNEVTDKSLALYQTHDVHGHIHDALRRGVHYKSQACSAGHSKLDIDRE